MMATSRVSISQGHVNQDGVDSSRIICFLTTSLHIDQQFDSKSTRVFHTNRSTLSPMALPRQHNKVLGHSPSGFSLDQELYPTPPGWWMRARSPRFSCRFWGFQMWKYSLFTKEGRVATWFWWLDHPTCSVKLARFANISTQSERAVSATMQNNGDANAINQSINRLGGASSSDC